MHLHACKKAVERRSCCVVCCDVLCVLTQILMDCEGVDAVDQVRHAAAELSVSVGRTACQLKMQL